MIVRKIVGAVLTLVLLAQLQGCGTYSWREDVRLGDGRIINVKRIEKYTGWGGIGNSCSNCRLKNARLSFEIDGKIVEWESIRLSGVPMILDIVDGVPVLVSIPGGAYCPKHLSGDRSNTYYVYNIYRDGMWVHSATPPFPIVQRRNLHLDRPLHKKDLTIEAKDAEVDSIIRKKFKMDYPFYLIVDDADKQKCNAWGGLEDRP